MASISFHSPFLHAFPGTTWTLQGNTHCAAVSSLGWASALESRFPEVMPCLSQPMWWLSWAVVQSLAFLPNGECSHGQAMLAPKLSPRLCGACTTGHLLPSTSLHRNRSQIKHLIPRIHLKFCIHRTYLVTQMSRKGPNKMPQWSQGPWHSSIRNYTSLGKASE